MKFKNDRPGFLWQAIIVFMVLMDSVVLFLSIISNLRFVTINYVAIFDLIVSVILLFILSVALYKSSNRKSYLRRNWYLFYGCIPFYLIAIVTGVFDGYILLFKLLNLIKIIILYLSAQKFAREVIKYQEQTRLVYALAIFLLVLFICSFIFYGAEHAVNPEVATYEDSLWFVLQTITTVGYGDINPITGIGRMMGVISMLSALALTSIITSVATFSLMEKFRKGTEELTARTKKQVEILKDKMDKIDEDFTEFHNSKYPKLEEDIADLKNELKEIKELLKEK